MPDWTYQPLFRPILFRLPPSQSRNLVLKALGRLARTPGGLATIGALGHMKPPADLGLELSGIRFPGPVGFGAGLDPAARALPALARFGFGFVEAGPVTLAPRPDPGLIRPDDSANLLYPDPLANPGAQALEARLRSLDCLPVPLGIRLATAPPTAPSIAIDEVRSLIQTFGPLSDFLVLDLAGAWDPLGTGLVPGRDAGQATWPDALIHAAAEAGSLNPPRPIFLRVPPDADEGLLTRHLAGAAEAGFAGVVLAGGLRQPAVLASEGSRAISTDRQREAALMGLSGQAAALQTLRKLRAIAPAQLVIIGSGGIVEPADALAMFEAGADLVQVHSGLVFSGPGLPKRINEALLWGRSGQRSGQRADSAERRPLTGTKTLPFWLGFLALGLLLIVGGALAGLVGATRVVLAYDLAYLGLDRAGLAAINPRLLAFMAHDRISLAGVLVSIGVLYTALAWHAIRRGEHWAHQSVFLSALVGMASFFLFIFHGYFDPLHFLQWIIAILCFSIGSRWKAEGPPSIPRPDLINDRAWRAATLGQLLFVTLAVGLIGGGITIAAIGSSSVFVPEDLEFLHTSRAALEMATPRLLPLIAHDRAAFGGALVADGLVLLTAVLWGFRRGARWLWTTLLLAGPPGLAAALSVHVAVGYLDLAHLAPPLLALLLYLAGLALMRDYLCGKALAVAP